MTARPYWTCRRARRDDAPYLIAVTLSDSPFAAREAMCPRAMVLPVELVTPALLDQVADLGPGEIRELEVDRLPSWRDAHGPDNLLNAQYCDDIGYSPT